MSQFPEAMDPVLRNLKHDVPAGIAVFLVAIPLCLGIALASGAPPLSGLLAGIIGGLVVSLVSGSALSVSGPAAGLVVVVLSAIEAIGFAGLLMATALSGLLQMLFGFLRLGRIGAFVPSSVIKGMLAAIGLILVINQLPMLAGLADWPALEDWGSRALSAQFSGLALLIALVSFAVLLLWDRPVIKRSVLGNLPGPLVVVIVAVLLDRLVPSAWLSPLTGAHRIELPIDAMGVAGIGEFLAQLHLPSLTSLADPQVYVFALTLALVASLETLLSLEAVDKIDPLKRHSPPHRELKAQGLGNLLSGLVGGLPITAVIVRSSANVQAGGRSRTSSFVHGALLLVTVACLAPVLEQMPLACLAAILIHTGFKLASPRLWVEQYRKGLNRLVPFAATLTSVVVIDLLKGVLVGMFCGLCFMIRANFRRAVSFRQEGQRAWMRFLTDVSFLNREEVRSKLENLKPGTHLVIDGQLAAHVDPDIRDDIEAYARNAPDHGISVQVRDLRGFSGHFPASRTIDDGESLAAPGRQVFG
ncbi:SulP family inorganic anion transporter [Marinobacter sp. JSM 1782161]|uniref:SulP family inorganic anion transporter n=1 Tax=Marinobacter sp. JSM 1782161 TaxID=2685906 RepID=UPI001A9D99AE|nr:SulP family inorganic anion transporter [Marinobacter sp. JSM 1782161]